MSKYEDAKEARIKLMADLVFCSCEWPIEEYEQRASASVPCTPANLETPA
jgi:hypothetical protein